jgi:hypothetical protein
VAAADGRLSAQANNPREVAFAREWQKEHAQSDMLAQLCEPVAVDHHVRIARGTLVQWLGSNVGMSFLREALGKCGYEIVQSDLDHRISDLEIASKLP